MILKISNSIGSHLMCDPLSLFLRESEIKVKNLELFLTLFGLTALQRSEQFKACEHRPQGAYLCVSDQGGAEHNAEMRRLYEEKSLERQPTLAALKLLHQLLSLLKLL